MGSTSELPLTFREIGEMTGEIQMVSFELFHRKMLFAGKPELKTRLCVMHMAWTCTVRGFSFLMSCFYVLIEFLLTLGYP